MIKKIDSAIPSPRRSFWKRRSVRLLTGLIACTILFLIALPIGTKLYLQKWFVENGADKATIEKVRLNPFTGVAALHGVDIQKDGKTVFSNSTIFIDIGLKNLLHREANLQQVSLVDLVVDIERYDDSSLRVASYGIPPNEDDSVAGSSNVVEELGQNIPWIFRAKEIGIKNVTVRYKQPDLNIELVIEDALIEKFNTDPNDKEGALSLKGTFNGAPLTLDLSTLNIAPEVEVVGEMSITGVHLDDMAEFLGKYIKPFSGIAGIHGNINFSMTDAGSLDVLYEGLVNLENGDIGGESWTTKGDISWDGEVSFSMQSEKMSVDAEGSLRALNAAFKMPDPVIDIENSDINITGKTTVTVTDKVVVETNASLALTATTFGMDSISSSIGNTSWNGNVRIETGTESKGLTVRADGELQIFKPVYSMDIDGALMEAGNDMISFDGTVEYITGVGSDSTSYVRTDGTLVGEAIQFSLPKTIQFSQSKLDLAGKTEIAMGQKTIITYDGDLLLDETGVEMTGVTLGEKQFSWSGQVEYLLGEQGQKITLSGGLKTEGILVDLEETGLHIEQRTLQAKSDFSLLLEETPSFAGEISIEGGGLQINQKDVPLLTLEEISMSKAKDNGTGGVTINSLILGQLDIPSSEIIPVSMSVPSITVSDIHSPDLTSVHVAQLIVKGLEIVDSNEKTLLAQLETITVETIQVDKDITATVGQITIGKGSFLKEKDKDPMATMERLKIAQINYSPKQGLSFNTVDLDSIFTDFSRQKTEELEKPEENQAKKETSKAEESVKTAGLPVKINQINITGSSGFTFTDNTLTESFSTTFTLDSLQVSDIDLTNPDHPFTYSLKGTFDKYTPLNIKGTSAPLAENIFVEQQTTLQSYSMLHASPYTIDAIGTYFPSGRLDLTSSLKIRDGKIDMENNLVFKELEAETVQGELADKLNNQLPVPLDLALAMLRDGAGTIELKIPLKGDLEDMNVDVTDIIITALGKGISVAVVPYLAYTTLGPAGALAFLGAKVGSSLLHTDMPSLKFESGGTALTEDHSITLDKVGKIIEKDKENYSICAKVSIDELHRGDRKKGQNKIPKAARKKLFELGETRSLTVKEYLLSHFDIDEKQLLICNPGINFEDGVKATIEFKQ